MGWDRVLTAFALIAAAGCAPAGSPEPEKPNRFDDRPPAECLAAADCNRTMVCAHRGYRLHAPENTIASFTDAIDLGVDFIEIDVRETADDQLAVIHDSTVDRTTHGTGEVSQMTLAEVQALLVIQKEGDERDDAQTVPSLAETLAVTVGHVMVDIDMKTGRGDLVAQAVLDAGALDYVVVHKSNADTIAEMLAIAPDLRVMPSAKDADAVIVWDDDIGLSIVEVDADLAQNVPESYVETSHERGIKVFLNVLGLPDFAASVSGDPSYWGERASSGVDVMQTDYPHLLLPYLDEAGYR